MPWKYSGRVIKVWGTANPDANTFGGGLFGPNGSGTKIAYCFHSVEGYSKLGVYEGNGSTDGPFVYTGFRPAFTILKRTDSTASWLISDNKRDPHNLVTTGLFPNGSGADTTGYDLDFLSNGFKRRTIVTGKLNLTGLEPWSPESIPVDPYCMYQL